MYELPIKAEGYVDNFQGIKKVEKYIKFDIKQ